MSVSVSASVSASVRLGGVEGALPHERTKELAREGLISSTDYGILTFDCTGKVVVSESKEIFFGLAELRCLGACGGCGHE